MNKDPWASLALTCSCQSNCLKECLNFLVQDNIWDGDSQDRWALLLFIVPPAPALEAQVPMPDQKAELTVSPPQPISHPHPPFEETHPLCPSPHVPSSKEPQNEGKGLAIVFPQKFQRPSVPPKAGSHQEEMSKQQGDPWVWELISAAFPSLPLSCSNLR